MKIPISGTRMFRFRKSNAVVGVAAQRSLVCMSRSLRALTLLSFLSLFCLQAQGVTFTWTGTVDGNWSDPLNWDWDESSPTQPNVYPNAIEVKVIIPSATTDPVIPSTDQLLVGDLEIQEGAVLTQEGGSLTLHGNYQNAGTYEALAGTFVLAASGDDTEAFVPWTGVNKFNNLTINSGITAKFDNDGPINIQVSGSFTNNGTANLTSEATVVTFNGSGEQVLAGTATTTFYDLTIDNLNGVSVEEGTVVPGIVGDLSGVGLLKGPAASGDGTMTVSPTAIDAGTTLPTLLFTFGDGGKDWKKDQSLVTMTVPAGWSLPTSGNMTLDGEGFNPAPVFSSDTITITFTDKNPAFTITYKPETIPSTAGSNTFNTATQKISGGALSISEHPMVALLGPIDHYDVSAPTPVRANGLFLTAVTAMDANNNPVNTDSSTVVTMSSSSGNTDFDANGDGTVGDHTKTLVNGVFTIYTKNSDAETITITATAGTASGDSADVVVGAQTIAGDYRSKTSGNWADAASWETYVGSSWVTASAGLADATDQYITVLSGHTITSEDAVEIEAAGALTVESGGTFKAFKPGNKPDQNLEINGQLLILGGTVTCKDLSGIGVMMMNGGELVVSHDYTPSIPENFVATGGTVEFSGKAGGTAFTPNGEFRFHHVKVSGENPGFHFNTTSRFLLTGNFTNNGTEPTVMEETTFEFLASQTQTVGGSQGTSFDTLIINNNIALVLPSSATIEKRLSGEGVISGNVTMPNAVKLMPGNGGIGTLTTSGSVTLEEGSIYEVEVNASPNGNQCDKLVVSGTGTLELGGVAGVGGATLDIGTLSGAGCTIMISPNNILGTFNGLDNHDEVQAAGGGSPAYYIHYNQQDTSDNLYHVTITTEQSPTSSGIDLRAYQAADGVYVEFIAYDVEEDGTIELQLLDESGAVIWSGSVDATAGPKFIARFLVPGLELGETYSFRVRDEVGKWWDASGIKVGGFNAEMTSATLTGITLTFDSLPDHEYDIQWTGELGGTWQTVTNVTATVEQTSVVVAYPEDGAAAGFFRVQVR